MTIEQVAQQISVGTDSGIAIAIIALVGSLFGGASVKLLEKKYEKKKNELDDASEIRKELREENRKLKEELARLIESHYNLLREHNELKADYSIVSEQSQYIRGMLGVDAAGPITSEMIRSILDASHKDIAG